MRIVGWIEIQGVNFEREEVILKFVYYSSVLNHHQRALCDELYKELKEDFTFVSSMEMEQQRLQLGYVPEVGAPYELKAYNHDCREEAIRKSLECDIFLGAVFPTDILHARMKKNQITFRHIETYFKQGKYRILSPNAARIAYSEHFAYRNKQLYLLCASAHVADDVGLFHAYPDKKFKWGYFPRIETDLYEKENNSNKIELLWVGRMIDWKRPLYAVKAVEILVREGVPIHLTMVGTGSMTEQIQGEIKAKGLSEYIDFLGPKSPKEVRNIMRKSDIYLFTSTREEGWGAVLNEAMGSGCAVVASAEAGATGYLINNHVNGLVYSHNSFMEFLECVRTLCKDVVLRNSIMEKSRETIADEWNYKIAAQRLVKVSELLMSGCNPYVFYSGPMSKG